jgi:hypothetical protein
MKCAGLLVTGGHRAWWPRDSNIILGEQMNTRGYDSSRLLPTHKGVGILRRDGETQGGADSRP